MPLVSSPVLGLLGLFLIAAVTGWVGYRLGLRRAHQSAEELTNLNEVSRNLLRAQLSVSELAEMLYWQVGQIVPAASFQLGLFEGDGYRVIAWARDSQRLPETYFPEAGTKGIVGWVRETGQPLLIRDFQKDRKDLPAFPEFSLDDPPSSGLFVPLMAGTSTIGVVAVQSKQPSRFNVEHLRLLNLLANQAAWAIRNAQLFERAQRRANQLHLIGQVTSQISSVQPLPTLLKQVVSLAKQKFEFYCVSIFLQEGDVLHIGASTDDVFLNQTPSIEVGIGMIGWAAKNGMTAVANNVMEDARYRHLGILPETQSEVSLPLKVEDRILGVLDVQSNQLGAFSTEDVFVLETLAAQIGLAIEQAQTYDAEHALAQRLEGLIRVSQTVVSVLDLDDLLDQLVDLISETFGFRRVHIFLRADDRIAFRAGVGPHTVRWTMDGLTYALDDPGLIPIVAKDGIAKLVSDTKGLPGLTPGPGLDDTRSELIVPIKMAGHVLGVIDIQSNVADSFRDEDLILMQALADSVAVAIRNAALYLNEKKRANLAETLREISAAVASDLDLDHVLAAILDGLSHVVYIDSAAILLLDNMSATLTVTATVGENLAGIEGHQVLVDRAAMFEPGRLETIAKGAYQTLLNVPLEQVCITVPLRVSGELIGFLLADQGDPRQHSPNDDEIIDTFANQAAVAINNARLYSSQQSEAWVTTALLQVAEAVNAQINVSEAMETIARLTALLAGVNKVLIMCWDTTRDAYVLGAMYPHQPHVHDSAPPFSPSEHPYFELLTVAERPVGAGMGHRLPLPRILEDMLGVQSIMGFPLKAKHEQVGILIVDDSGEGRPYDARMLNVLKGIAHQTAMALEAANLQASVAERDKLEQELRVAHQIQRSFIPDSPPVEPGWDIAATWRAAHQVSGDFYDFIPLQNGLWGLAIADVADKGMPAALFMAMCRTLLRAAAISRTSPAATLMRVNELLFNDSRGDLFVTALYAVWNPASGEIIYANAGHNPPLLVSGSRRRIARLQNHGIALGVVPKLSLSEGRTMLMPGDYFVAYTDGITEAMRNDQTEWGISRFRNAVKALRGESSSAMVSQILGALDDFVGDAAQSDDVTLWVLKRLS